MSKRENPTSYFRDANSSETNDEDERVIEKDVNVIAIFEKDKGPRNESIVKLNRAKRSESIRQLLDKRHEQTGTRDNRKTEVILLDLEPSKQQQRQYRKEELFENRHVIELSDERSKMALRAKLEREIAPEAHPGDGHRNILTSSGKADYEGTDIFRKLPAGTIVVKQDSRSNRDDSDYVRDSTETNSSGGSSSTSGYAANKVKRIHRAIRNKNRNTVEVRRNPMRVTKKDIDKDFPRPRQRLLSAKRKECLASMEASKRGRSSSMPYMNTRSVTRKMYTVGATYQAPTVRDETEWKEWPTHGMHERPIYHPQFGLAAEYLGRYFISLDGLSYREIIDQPEIEVVSVDPHSEWPSSPNEMTRGRKRRAKNLETSSAKDRRTFPQENKSFAMCMHGSLHCVLAYCSQVMSPAYNKNVGDKLTKLQQDDNYNLVPTSSQSVFVTEKKEKNPETVTSERSMDNTTKSTNDGNLLEGYTIAMAQSIKNAGQVPKKIPQSSSTSKFHFTEAPKSSSSFPQLRNLQGSQFKIHDIARPKNSVILLKSSDTKSSGCSSTNAQFLKAMPKELNLTKLEDTTISDEALMELSSIYKNLVPTDELTSSCENSPIKNIPCKKSQMKMAKKSVDLTLTKRLFLDKQQQQVSQETQNNSENVIDYEFKPNNTNNLITDASSSTARPWGTTDASEIAKILSEYNRSAMKQSAIQSQNYCPTGNVLKPNVLHTESRPTKVEFLNNCSGRLRDNTQIDYTLNNAAIKFSQGKWRRFHFTVEKLNNSNSSTMGKSNEKNSATLQESEQLMLSKEREIMNNASSYMRGGSQRKYETSMKKSNTFEQHQAITSEIEEKKSMSTESSAKRQSLQELLENTAILYCAAAGVHQDDLVNYIDTLDSRQSMQWLENWNKPTT